MVRITCAQVAGVGLSVCLLGGALGQTCTPGWGEGFANPQGFNGEIRAIAMFDDGSGPTLYAGGHFSSVNGQVARGIARWEGDRWTEVGGGISPVSVGTGLGGGGVYTLAVLDTGSGPALYAGGVFSYAGKAQAMGVARWNGNSWSAMGAGLSDQVRAFTVFDDGTGPAIYAAGKFQTSGETPVRGLAKWTGTAWTQVGGGLLTGTTPYGLGYSLGVFDLGQGPRLVVGGTFRLPTGVVEQYWHNIAAWDGDSWSGFGSGIYGTNGFVMKLVMHDHGAGPQLTACGAIALTPTGTVRPRVMRWTGGQWVQVGSDLSGDGNNYVNSMEVVHGAAGAVLHIGGWFAGATWLNAANYAARFGNGDWVGLDGGMAGAGTGASHVRCMLQTEEAGRTVLYAAGAFTVAGDSVASRVAKWDGTRWHALESGRGLITPWSYPSLPAYGRSACTFDDGSGERTFVGGEFIGAGDRVCNSIAAWDGGEWHPLGSGLTRGGAPGQVFQLSSFDDGSGAALYAAGEFDHGGGSPCFGVARWNGTFWSAPGGTGLWRNYGSGWGAGGGFALKAHDDGSGPALYVGGQFDSAGSSPAGGIARWNGNSWSGLGNGVGVPQTYSVDALEVFDEGAGPRLFVGGGFSSIGGIEALSIARWDGTAWSEVAGGFPAPTGNISVVRDLAVLDDGSGPALIAAGSAGYTGTHILLLSKWDGITWSELGTPSGAFPEAGSASSAWSFDDGHGPAICVGGALRVSGHADPVGLLMLRQGVWELPGVISHPPVQQNTAVAAGAVRSVGDRQVVLLAGLFTQVGGSPSMGVAEWVGCPTCRADCDRDGVLSANDFGCFQTKFVAGDPYADCNTDGALTAADFGCFQTEFVAGCP